MYTNYKVYKNEQWYFRMFNVSGIIGKTTFLVCTIRNLSNYTVSVLFKFN